MPARVTRDPDNPQPDEHALKASALDRLEHCLRQARTRFGRRFPCPEVRWDLRGRAAGQVRLPLKGAPLIRFNLQLLRNNGDAFIDRTVPHEAAHLVVHRLYGRRARPHGPEWRSVMRLFGADASRCHDYDVSQATVRRLTRFPYRCDCREHQITSIRRNRMAAGQVYHCRVCGGRLRPAN